jgi:DNA-binding HxlR family transcriptional regulator
MIHLNNRQYNCNIEVIVDVIGGKWKMLILWNLRDGGIKRFNELRRLIPGSTQKMLTAQLRELERDFIVQRKVYPQVPPKVEYSLTKYGLTLKSFIELSCAMGNGHMKHVQKNLAKQKARVPKELALA